MSPEVINNIALALGLTQYGIDRLREVAQTLTVLDASMPASELVEAIEADEPPFRTALQALCEYADGRVESPKGDSWLAISRHLKEARDILDRMEEQS